MSTRLSHVWALIEKDLRIHGRDLLAAQGAVLGIGALALTLKPGEDAVNAALVFNLNVLLAGLWSEWLISREKTKGTFAWLRACAISDTELVLSKFLAVGLCTTTLWAVSAVLFVHPAMSEWVALWLGLLAFSGLAVVSRWRFGPKLGQVLPYAALLVPLLAVIALERLFEVRVEATELIDQTGQYIAAVLLLVIWVALFAGARAWVGRSDTYRLLE